MQQLANCVTCETGGTVVLKTVYKLSGGYIIRRGHYLNDNDTGIVLENSLKNLTSF